MTPRLAVIDDRYINYDGHPVISVLADPDATPETVAAMRAALVAAVRDADTLRQARETARLVRALQRDDCRREAILMADSLLDLLSPAPQGEGTQTTIECCYPLGEYGRCELTLGHEGDHAGAPQGEGTAVPATAIDHIDDSTTRLVPVRVRDWDAQVAESARLWDTEQTAIAFLLRMLREYLAGNRIVDGYWYSPDETGAPHYRNDRATADELALVESLRTEIGL